MEMKYILLKIIRPIYSMRSHPAFINITFMKIIYYNGIYANKDFQFKLNNTDLK